MQKIIDFFNERIKRFTIFDIKLIQGIGIFVALIIAKLFPRLLSVNLIWFIALLILFSIRPVYLVYIKK